MCWNIGGIRNFFIKLKSKLGFYHVVLTTPETSSEKFTLTVVEVKRLTAIEKSDLKEQVFCLIWTVYNTR